MKKIIWYASQVTEFIAEWVDALLPLLRVLVPVIMLNVMLCDVHAIYISELGIEITSVAMRCIISGVHIIAAWIGIQTENSRGWLYEIASCFLATEIVLYIYFVQYQFAMAALLLIIFSMGIVWLSIYGRKHLLYGYRRGYIPQVLMDDIIASSKDGNKVNGVFSVALRRYLVIAQAILLIVPSFVMIYNHSADGTKHISNEQAIIVDSYDYVVLNDNLEDAVEDVVHIISTVRRRTMLHKELIDHIKMTFAED